MVVLPFALLLLGVALVLIGHRARQVAPAADGAVARALSVSGYCCLILGAGLVALAGLLGYSLFMLMHYLPAGEVARLR